MPRIAYFTHTPSLSGGERSLLELLEVLDRRQWEPEVWVTAEGEVAEACRKLGIEVFCQPFPEWVLTVSRERFRLGDAVKGWRACAGPLGQLRRRLRERKIALLHTNSVKAHVWGSAITLGQSCKLVWHFRDILPSRFPVFPLLTWLARFPDRILSISQAVARQWPGLRQVSVVYNGIPLFPEDPEIREKREPFRIGMVAQIARWKGQELLLRALARLRGEFPALACDLVGGVLFRENEEDYARHLERLVRDLGLEGRVHWHGQVTSARSLMKQWALLVHPPLEPEPFGRVLVEAMAEGCPPVAARAGAVPEVVEEGVTGWLFRPGDAADLAAVLKAALSDPGGREMRGRAGVTLVRRRFDRQRCVQEIERVYRELLLG